MAATSAYTPPRRLPKLARHLQAVGERELFVELFVFVEITCMRGRGFNNRKAADTREDCGGISGENLGSDLGPQGPEAQWTAATTPPTDASRAHAAVEVRVDQYTGKPPVLCIIRIIIVLF